MSTKRKLELLAEMSLCRCGSCDACLERAALVLQRAFLLRDAVVNAVAWQNVRKLEGLLKSLLNFVPGKAALVATGLGRLLHDEGIWNGIDVPARGLLVAVRTKWRVDMAASEEVVVAKNLKWCGLVELKARPFLEAVAEISAWLLTVDIVPVDLHIARRVAILVVNAGFTNWQHLDGLVPTDLLSEEAPVCDAALLARAVAAAGVGASQARSRSFAAPGASTLGARPMVSADAMAVSFKPEVLQQADAAFEKEATDLGVAGLGTSLRPAQATLGLARARSLGLDVDSCLIHRATQLKLETQRKSLSSVAAGLKSWHAFAHAVLGYPASGTLPPRSAIDVMMYLTIFRVAETGSNYIGYVKWTCIHLGLGTSWFDDELKLTIKGAKKLAIRCGPTSAVQKQLLDDSTLAKLVVLADGRGLPRWSCLALLCWEFLLRVQSEALEMQAGVPGDATALAEGRHSGLWLDSSGALVLRLQRRKHRPRGSVLRRKCLCASVGRQLCVTHRLGDYIKACRPGEALFDFSANTFLGILKGLLEEVGVQYPQLYTLKTFRAGEATALAASGASLGQVLAAGEWRSRAVLDYVDEDVFDSGQLLNQSLDHSDCE